VDANYDGKTIDAFYGLSKVSKPIAMKGNEGLMGLSRVNVGYQANSSVLVWSLGPDGDCVVDKKIKANQGVNKDNILSWQ
jgi:hypothetical protein